MSIELNNLWYAPSVATSVERCVSGSFEPDGSSDPSTVYGSGFTVTYTATGVWTVEVAHSFAALLSAKLTIQLATADTDLHVLRIGDVDVDAKTFDIVHLASDDTTATHPAAADITADAANVVHFSVVLAATDEEGSGVA